MSKVETLLHPDEIRASAQRILDAALGGETHFSVHLENLEKLAEQVATLTRKNYPDLKVPFHSRWKHFQVGGVDRLGSLKWPSSPSPSEDRLRGLYDLVITSVLLDAGAGDRWVFQEGDQTYSRSEGLAVASFHLFQSGGLSSDPSRPLQADVDGLKAMTSEKLAEAFQISDTNPLEGVEGRTQLLNALGKAIEESSVLHQRPGDLATFFLEKVSPDKKLSSIAILRGVQDHLGSIWPGRVSLEGRNMGDVWFHQETQSYLPFHKLSQWLSYSLMEPLMELGTQIDELDRLTGLAEYRNGGLFLDGGVLELKDPKNTQVTHPPSSDLILEWRALTVALLDRIAPLVRNYLGFSGAQAMKDLPLTRILEGGTWWMGRKLAYELRPDGSPPLRIQSDGTVF